MSIHALSHDCKICFCKGFGQSLTLIHLIIVDLTGSLLLGTKSILHNGSTISFLVSDETERRSKKDEASTDENGKSGEMRGVFHKRSE
jgi:hypothetical protein